MSAGIIREIFLEDGHLGLGFKDRQRRGECPEQRRGGGKGQNQRWDVDQAWLEQRDREAEGTRTGIY